MRLRGLVALVGSVVCLGLVAGASPALARTSHVFSSAFGSAGSGDGQFSGPNAVAVDQVSGDVYVLDAGNDRVERFTSGGVFVSKFASAGSANGQLSEPVGIAVDNSGPLSGDVYVADSGNNRVERFTAAGAFVSTLTGTGAGAVSGVAVGPTGHVWVYANDGTVDQFSAAGSHLSSFNTAFGVSPGLGIDASEDLYVLQSPPSVEELSNAGLDLGTVDPCGCSTGVAVNAAAGKVYSDHSSEIAEFTGTSGTATDTFGTGHLTQGAGLAVNSETATVYVADPGANQVAVFPAATLPDVAIQALGAVANTTATLNGSVNPQGTNTTYQFEYGLETSYGSVAPVPAGAAGSGASTVPVTANPTGLTADTTYHYRLSATNSSGATYSEDQSFTTTGPPAVDFENAENVTKTSASLEASINPFGASTSYRFEYGTTTAYGAVRPVPDGELASGFGDQAASATLSGLQPNTTYHYRVRAESSLGTTLGADQTFETFPIARVSAVATEVHATSAVLGAHIAPLGDETTYRFEYGTSTEYGSVAPVPDGALGPGSLSEAFEGQPAEAQPITGLTPAATYHYRVVATNALGTLTGEDKTFTTSPVGAAFSLPDGRVWEKVSPADKNGNDIMEAETTSAASSGNQIGYASRGGFGNSMGSGVGGIVQYVAARAPGGWTSRAVTPTPALDADQTLALTTVIVDFSENMGHALVVAYDLQGQSDDAPFADNFYDEQVTTGALRTVSTPLTNGPVGQFALFVQAKATSSDFGHIMFQARANLLSTTSGPQPKLYDSDHGTLRLAGILPDGSVPPGGSEAAAQFGGSEGPWERDTISRDGSRILFLSPADGSAAPQLYMRKDAAATAWVSQPEASTGEPEPQSVAFQGASPDTRKVLFSTTSRLTELDPGGPGTALYLYTDSADPATEPNLTFITRVEGTPEVAGMSDDAGRIYYKGNEGLSLWDHGAIRLIVADGIRDKAVYGVARIHDSRVSSDGRRFAFLDNEKLTSADIGVIPGGELYPAMYLYDEPTNTLRCVSCAPTGQTTASEARVSPAQSGITISLPFRPRFLSSDGRRAFFSTADALVPEDTNGAYDTYEYDVETGQASLISSGTGAGGPQWFVDASASGDDVFFTSRERLLASDKDTLVDLYDARVNGGLPEPTALPPACMDEACQPASAPAPDLTPPSSPTGSGIGNLAPVPVASRPASRAKKKTPKHRRRIKHRAKKTKRNHKRAAPRAGR